MSPRWGLDLIAPRRLHLVLALLLGLHAVGTLVNARATSFGVDFYHYWAIPMARSADRSLGSPYPEVQRYAGALRTVAATVGDRRLRDAEQARRTLDLTGSPLSYALPWYLLPYSASFGLFQVVQLASLVGGVLALGRALGQRGETVLLLACTLGFAYHFFYTDLRVGNVNAIQLGVLAALTIWSAPSTGAIGPLDRRALAGGSSALQPLLVGAALSLLVLLKPTLLYACLAVAVSVAASQGQRALRAGLAGALLAAVPAILWPMWMYGAPRIWLDWFDELSAPGRLDMAVQFGNWAPARLISEALGSQVATISPLVQAGLALTALGAVAGRAQRLGGVRSHGVCAALEVAQDPWLLLSLAVVYTLLGGPLAWAHYYVLALIPLLWLWWTGPPGAPGRWAALAMLLLATPAHLVLIELLGGREWTQALGFNALGLALWVSLLRRVLTPGAAVHTRQDGAAEEGRTATLLAALLGILAAQSLVDGVVARPAQVPILVAMACVVVLWAIRLTRRHGLDGRWGAILGAGLLLTADPVRGALTLGALGDSPAATLLGLGASLALAAWMAARGQGLRAALGGAWGVVGLALTAGLALSGGSSTLLALACSMPAAGLALAEGGSLAGSLGGLLYLVLGATSTGYLARRSLPPEVVALLSLGWVPLWVGLLAGLVERGGPGGLRRATA